MSRFKKVSDNENIPDSINDALFKKANIQEDRYANLRDKVESRKAAISRESAGYKEEILQTENKPWEKISSAQFLSPHKFTFDEQMSNINPENVSVHGVRRAFYDTDGDSVSYRPNPNEMFNDPITAALKGHSMWLGDTDELDSLLTEMAEKDNENFDMRTAREKQLAKHNQWEADRMQEVGKIRESQFSSARAHQIIKSHRENVVAGKLDR